MHHVVNRRAGIRYRTAVDGTGGAKVRLHLQLSAHFQSATVKPEQQFRPAPHPLGAAAQKDIGHGDAGQHRGANTVASVVTARGGPKVQARGRGKTDVLNRRMIMRALRSPPRQAGLEAEVVANQIGSTKISHLNVIHQTFADAQQEDLQVVVDRSAKRFTNVAPDLDGGPDALGSLVAVSPVGWLAVVTARIFQFQTAAATGGPVAPATAIAVADFLDNDVAGVGDQDIVVRAHVVIRHCQGNALAAIGESAAVITERVRCIEIRIIGLQTRHLLGDHQIAVAGDHGVVGDGEIDSSHEPPIAHVHARGTAIVQLNVFIVAVAGDGAEHDLVDDNAVVALTAIGRPGRQPCHAVPRRTAIRIASGRNAVFLRAEVQRVDHTVSIRVHKENAFTARTERKASGVCAHGKRDKTASRDAGPVGNAKLVRAPLVRQIRTRQVEDLITVVVKFDEIFLWIVGMGQEFIDHHRTERIRAEWLSPPG